MFYGAENNKFDARSTRRHLPNRPVSLQRSRRAGLKMLQYEIQTAEVWRGRLYD
jgi:hypothetical protein